MGLRLVVRDTIPKVIDISWHKRNKNTHQLWLNSSFLTTLWFDVRDFCCCFSSSGVCVAWPTGVSSFSSLWALFVASHSVNIFTAAIFLIYRCCECLTMTTNLPDGKYANQFALITHRWLRITGHVPPLITISRCPVELFFVIFSVYTVLRSAFCPKSRNAVISFN